MENAPFKMKGYSYPGNSPVKKDEKFPGLLPEVEVKASDHQTQRDLLAKQARSNYSGSPKPDMEQSVRSQSYRDADKYIASKSKARTTNVKKSATLKRTGQHHRNVIDRTSKDSPARGGLKHFTYNERPRGAK
jgi:hypothetical protein